MLEKDQIIKVKDLNGTYLAVITKILSDDYISCIKADGTVVSAVYTGYIDPCDGTKIMLSNMLEGLKILK